MEKSNSQPAIGSGHRRVVRAFLESVNGPFRRQQLTALLYPLTSPRSRLRAESIAQAFIKELAKAGEIQRNGHLHWVKVSRKRTLRSGRDVPELPEMVALTLQTRCPDKWAAVDLETGEVWMGAGAGWKRATKGQEAEIGACLAAD